MTSGVYQRKPGQKRSGPPRLFTGEQVALIKSGRAAGKTMKWLSSKWRASEKTIRQVLKGIGAYKELK